MAKLSLDEIQSVLSSTLTPQDAKTVLVKLEQVVKELEEEKDENKLPKQKNQYSIIVFDQNGQIPKEAELVGAVVQLPLSEDVGTLLGKISDAAKEQSEQSKKKAAIGNLAEACEVLKGKYQKSLNFKIKTKELVRVLISDSKFV